MYCDKASVNILCALMVRHGVRDVVVCPGSRNAVLAHNFGELSRRGVLRVWPVTDERCAAFVAIGIYLATRTPAAVCVTSGSALLNTLPAVAEAYYRRAALLIISADRPPEAIGHLWGQTLPQTGALQPYTRTWQLPEGNPVAAAREADAALCALRSEGGRPVHINVPLTEPLFSFTTASLPSFSDITAPAPPAVNPIPPVVMAMVEAAARPAIFVGHMDFPPETLLEEVCRRGRLRVIGEGIGTAVGERVTAEMFGDEACRPDLLVHIGGTVVRKETRLAFQHLGAPVVRIEESADAAPDTFGHLAALVRGNTSAALRQLAALAGGSAVSSQSVANEANMPRHAVPTTLSHIPVPPSPAPSAFAQVAHEVVCLLAHSTRPYALHAGNSTAVRLLADIGQPRVHFFCNRGVNGIEGSLSVAAGHALGGNSLVICLLGDLSFFYDSNALWNESLDGKLRVLVMNDGGGAIFNRLPGLHDSQAQALIAAHHSATAEGVCCSYNARYLAARTPREAATRLPEFLFGDSARPVVLECFL
ncbi:MAG: hypothetical protein J6M53_09460 [Bacteroidaceae bacterium]|nr:hypothetical protein [Bacteroidaceae bacterium]